MLSLTAQERFRQIIRRPLGTFIKQLNYENFDFEGLLERFTVWSDIDKFKYTEDEFVWHQKKGNITKVHVVSLDGRNICDFDDTMSEQMVLERFWKGFKEAYEKENHEPGKVFLDSSNYEKVEQQKKQAREEVEQAKIKEIEKKEVKSETQAVAKEIALDVAKKNASTSSS